MRSVTLDQAMADLPQLVEQAAHGEEFIIAIAGKPMVKVVPLAPAERPRRQLIGCMKGEFVIPDDFDAMDAEIEASFYENPIEPPER